MVSLSGGTVITKLARGLLGLRPDGPVHSGCSGRDRAVAPSARPLRVERRLAVAKSVRTVARLVTVVFTVATLTYYFDPSSGRGRRARLGEQSNHTARRLTHRTGRAARDLGNRLLGFSAKLRALFR